jgi:hypothetical protein
MKEIEKELHLKHEKINSPCPICQQAKAKRAKIGKQGDNQYKATQPVEILHSDLVGTISLFDPKTKKRVKCPTHSGHLYTLVVTDEFSHTVWIFLLKRKEEASQHIKQLIELLHNQTGRTVKRWHSDGGGEFVNDELKLFFRNLQIEFTYSPARTPERNGLAERMNRTLFEMVRCLILHAGCHPAFWGEALTWATHVYNSTPHPITDYKTPFEILFNYKYDLKKLKVWGCDAHVLLEPKQQTKIGSRTWTGIFIGFDRATSSYRIIRPSDRRVIATRNVQYFAEDQFQSIQSLQFSSNRKIEYDSDPPSDDDDESIEDPSTTSSQSALKATALKAAPVIPVPASVSMGVSEQTESKSSPDGGVDKNKISPPDQSELNPDDQIQSDLEPESAEPEVDEAKRTDRPVVESNEPTTNNQIQIDESERSDRPVDESERTDINPSADPINEPSVQRSRYGRTIKSTQSLLNNLDAYGKDQQRYALNQSLHDEYAYTVLVNSYSFDELFCTVNELSEQEPIQFKDAVRSIRAAEWWAAMKEEFNSLLKQGVFSLVPRPSDRRILKGRWVYKIKLGPLNEILRRKARFVAKGFLQEYGTDYTETHSPVARMKSIKLILSLTARFDLELHQLDYKTAFLNAPVDEEIYMEQPEGFNEQQPDMVLRLHKSLYGLKQASRNWNLEISKFVVNLGYTQLQSDSCIYIKKSRTGRLIILALYVDDTIIVVHKDDLNEWFTDKSAINEKYEIEDLGECQWILNMKLTRDRRRRTITLSQAAYIARIVEEYELTETRAVSTPAEKAAITDRPLDGSEPIPLDQHQHERYRSLIGAILYAANITRPDIAFSVGQLARYVSQPCRHHLRAAHRVLNYLRLNPNIVATFGGNSDQSQFTIKASNSEKGVSTIEAYSDADWAGCPETRRSTSGGIIRFNGDVISWISKKQKTVALSSAESEYIALTEVAKEVRWVQQWVNEVLGILIPGTIKCDNRAAILLTAADTIHERTKHFDLKIHFIREQVKAGNITLEWVQSQMQHADILTKPLDSATFIRLRDSIMRTEEIND